MHIALKVNLAQLRQLRRLLNGASEPVASLSPLIEEGISLIQGVVDPFVGCGDGHAHGPHYYSGLHCRGRAFDRT